MSIYLDKSLPTEERLPGHEHDPVLRPDPGAAAALLPLDVGGDGVHQAQHRPHQEHHLGRGGGGQGGSRQGEHVHHLYNGRQCDHDDDDDDDHLVLLEDRVLRHEPHGPGERTVPDQGLGPGEGVEKL